MFARSRQWRACLCRAKTNTTHIVGGVQVLFCAILEKVAAAKCAVPGESRVSVDEIATFECHDACRARSNRLTSPINLDRFRSVCDESRRINLASEDGKESGKKAPRDASPLTTTPTSSAHFISRASAHVPVASSRTDRGVHRACPDASLTRGRSRRRARACSVWERCDLVEILHPPESSGEFSVITSRSRESRGV